MNFHKWQNQMEYVEWIQMVVVPLVLDFDHLVRALDHLYAVPIRHRPHVHRDVDPNHVHHRVGPNRHVLLAVRLDTFL